MKLSILLLLVVVGACPSHAQLQVENRDHMAFSDERARIIFKTACRVVEEEFHLKRTALSEFPLTLVLGSSEDQYQDNHDAGIYRIELKSWDEKKFAVGVIRLAIERMVSRDVRDRLVRQILTRSNAISPLSVLDERH
jgi:hypothetical protein